MIEFGVAGNSDLFFEEGNAVTEQMPSWLKGKGLDILEYSFGRGVRVGDKKISLIKDELIKNNIDISVHAPYYINFANPDQEKINRSFGYLLDSLKALDKLGGQRAVFHPGAQQKQPREVAQNNILIALQSFIKIKNESGLENKIICAETMGKIGQMGTVDEIIEMVNLDDSIYPCVDFGHVNAREQGSLKTEKDFENIILKFLNNVGEEKTKHMHIHFSKIEYSKGGEVRHLTFADHKFGPEFEPFANVLVKYQLEPIIISESAGTQAIDAMYMKKIYTDLASSSLH